MLWICFIWLKYNMSKDFFIGINDSMKIKSCVFLKFIWFLVVD